METKMGTKMETKMEELFLELYGHILDVPFKSQKKALREEGRDLFKSSKSPNKQLISVTNQLSKN